MLRIPWSVNLNRLMYVAMICLLGEFVCAVCGLQDHRAMSMRAVGRCGQPHIRSGHRQRSLRPLSASASGPEPVIYLDRLDFQLAVIGNAVSMPKEWANGSAMPFVQSIAGARASSEFTGWRAS